MTIDPNSSVKKSLSTTAIRSEEDPRGQTGSVKATTRRYIRLRKNASNWNITQVAYSYYSKQSIRTKSVNQREGRRLPEASDFSTASSFQKPQFGPGHIRGDAQSCHQEFAWYELGRLAMNVKRVETWTAGLTIKSRAA
jgi:hypothetical protein